MNVITSNSSTSVSISLCICTYNRCESLRVTLSSILECCNEFCYGDEILIIDNNSTDKTEDVVQSFHDRLPVTYVFEGTQGLSAARNKALSVFRGSIVIFIDDDITVAEGFIERYRDNFLKYPESDFFGGKISADWQGNRPSWLKSDDLVLLNGLFGQYDLGRESITYSDGMLTPFGANFALRKALIEKIGFFDLGLGVSGSNIGRGEETDYFSRAMALGFTGLYCANVMVGHRFQKERINIPYLYRYGFEKGRASYFLDGVRSNAWFISTISFFIKGLYQLMKRRRDRFYQCVINIGIRRGVYCESLHLDNEEAL